MLQAVGAGLLETLEEKDLMARVKLLQHMPQLCHGVAPGWRAQGVVNESLYKLLRDIVTGEIAVGELTPVQTFIKGNGLSSKRNRALIRRRYQQALLSQLPASLS